MSRLKAFLAVYSPGKSLARTAVRKFGAPFYLFNSPLVSFLPYLVISLFLILGSPLSALLRNSTFFMRWLPPLPVYLPLVTGTLAVDILWYLVGRFSKVEWLLRLHPKFAAHTGRVEQLQHIVNVHAPRMLFISKLTLGLTIPTLVATGLTRVPLRRWVGMLVLGELIKSAVLLSAGYYCLLGIQHLSEGSNPVFMALAAVVIISLGMVWFKRRKQVKESQ